jgi:hypothetical protein
MYRAVIAAEIDITALDSDTDSDDDSESDYFIPMQYWAAISASVFVGIFSIIGIVLRIFFSDKKSKIE